MNYQNIVTLEPGKRGGKPSHKTIGAFALLVAWGIAAVCPAQDKQQPTSRPSIKMMSHEEFTKAGLSKLNNEEIKALDEWLQKHTVVVPPEKTAFHVGMEYGTSAGRAQAITDIRLFGKKCVIWSKAPGRPSYSPQDYYRCSGTHPLSEGEPVAWKCETKDGYTFTQITIDSTTYDLAKGRLFLLSRKAGALKLLQLNPDMTMLKPVEELEKDNPEIRHFFEK